MIDVNVEKPFGFPTFSKQHPIRPSVATLRRWALKGLRGVKLETVKIGGRRYTTFEAIDRFAARLTEPRALDMPNDSERRRREVAQAAEKSASIFGGRTLN